MALTKGSTKRSVELDEIPEVPESIPRDRWDRPLIEPLNGGKPVAYTRASTLGKAIEDTYHLSRWQQRCVAFGLSRRPDLVALVASIATNEGDDRAPLDELCEKAHEAAKGDKGANVGTALHKLSERRDKGEDLSYLPVELKRAMDAYAEQMRPFRVLAAETFVVCDPVLTAGTFDRVVELLVDLEFHHRGGKGRIVLPAGTVLVLDLKTGKIDSAKYWGPTYGVQQTVYACGQPYRFGVGRVTWEALLGEGRRPSTDWALILHVPSDSPEDAGLVIVDLAEGAGMADLAVEVRAARKSKGLLSEAWPSPTVIDVEPLAIEEGQRAIEAAVPAQAEAPTAESVPISEAACAAHGPHPATVDCPDCMRSKEVLRQVADAADEDALNAIWSFNRDLWTDEHTDAVKARIHDLYSDDPAAAEPDDRQAERVLLAQHEHEGQTAKPGQVVKLELMAALRAAPDEAAINALWERHQTVWTEDATRMVKARLAELHAGASA